MGGYLGNAACWANLVELLFMKPCSIAHFHIVHLTSFILQLDDTRVSLGFGLVLVRTSLGFSLHMLTNAHLPNI